MELGCVTRSSRDTVVVRVTGELDIATEAQFRDCLQTAVDSGARRVVVDLDGVAFMDSSALGVLVLVFKTLRADDRVLCLAAPRGPVRGVLAATSVDRVIGVYDSVVAAENGDAAPSAVA